MRWVHRQATSIFKCFKTERNIFHENLQNFSWKSKLYARPLGSAFCYGNTLHAAKKLVLRGFPRLRTLYRKSPLIYGSREPFNAAKRLNIAMCIAKFARVALFVNPLASF